MDEEWKKRERAARVWEPGDWADVYLKHLAATGLSHDARATAGISKQQVWNRRKTDPTFKDAEQDAIEAADDRIERALADRAIEKDTPAAIFLLKQRRYQEKKIDFVVNVSADDLSKMSDDELSNFIKRMEESNDE